MMDEIPLEDQYVFTSMRYDGNGMKPSMIKRHSSMNGQGNGNASLNPVCANCPDAGKSAYLMKYHYDRLITAADHLGWYDTAKIFKGPVDLFKRIETAVTEHKKKTGNKCPFKVSLHKTCHLEFTNEEERKRLLSNTISSLLLAQSNRPPSGPCMSPTQWSTRDWCRADTGSQATSTLPDNPRIVQANTLRRDNKTTLQNRRRCPPHTKLPLHARKDSLPDHVQLRATLCHDPELPRRQGSALVQQRPLHHGRQHNDSLFLPQR